MSEPGLIHLDDLASALARLPAPVRSYLAEVLLDSLTEEDEEDEIAIEEEAHRRALEVEHGEAEGVDADEVIAALRTRHREAIADAAGLVEEAHRRWIAFQCGEEETQDADEVMAAVRTTFQARGTDGEASGS